MTFAMAFIYRWEKLFLETGNPIFAWRAYQAARRFKEEIPESILEYVDGAASGIVSLANNPPEAKNRPIEIAQALGLGKRGAGSGGPFKDYADHTRDFRMAVETFWEIKDTGKDYVAFSIIGEKYRMGESSVRRNYLSHLEQWRKTAANAIESGLLQFGENGKAQIETIGDADIIREVAIVLSLIDDLIKNNPA